MKTVNLEAQSLSLKIGPLVLINDKQNTKLTYKGILDLTTDIVIVKFEDLDDKTLRALSNLLRALSYLVDRCKKRTA